MSKMVNIKKLITENLDIWLTADNLKKTGRGRSSGSSNSIYGVQKLRELIFDCAVRGLLTHQNENENANKIILEISKIIEQKSNCKLIDYGSPFQNLPKNWCLTNLSSISYINPRNQVKDENVDASFIPMTLIPQIYSGKHLSEKRKWKDIKKGFTHFKSNDIGLAKITPCFENSKACVFESLENEIGAGTTELHIVRPIKYLKPKYVLIYFKSPTFLSFGEQYMTGTAGQKRLPKEFVSFFPFPLPPLEEQQRIVDKVDELMQLCDQLEQRQNLSSEAHDQLVDTLLSVLTNSSDVDEFQQNWQRISENFDLLFTTEYSIEQLKQTILQLAVMGKLVKQDPTDESASELLKQIAEEKARLVKEGKIKKSKPLPEITDEEIPYEIPHNWIWTRLDSLTSKIGAGSTPKGGKEVYVDSGIPFLRSQNVWNDGLALDDVAFISETTHQKMAGTHVQANDLLFNITGGSIGRCALVATNFKTANVSQHVTIVRSLHKDLASFLHLVLRSSYIQKLVMDVQVGVSREGLSIGKLSQFLIPLPSLSEQKRIIEKVEILNSIINSLQESLNKLQKNKLHLADSLVDNALSDSNKNKQTKAEAHLIEFVKPIEIVKQSKQKSADQIDLFADDSVEDDIKLLSLAAEITFQLHTEPTFGHLKLQKLIYLCQQLKNMNLVADFKQHAAGPYDPIMARYLDKEFKKREWFSYDSKRDLKYKPLNRCNDHRSAFNRYFAEDVSEIYDLIGLFRTSKSDHIEIVATLFACWLRLLEKKLSVTEEQLLKDFYAWSEEKKRFSKAEVLTGYKWMHQYSVIPQL